MIPRFHCPFPLHPGAVVALPDDAAHHALRVLRIAPGAPAVLFDGRGGHWSASLQPAGKQVLATLVAFDDHEIEPPLAVTLAQCLPAGDKMDLVVQKAVELGVARVVPIAAKRSVIRLSGERMARRVAHWQAIAIAAAEQSGRNRVPTVEPVVDLPQYLASAAAQDGTRWICLPQAPVRLRECAPKTNVDLLIGPESGFEESEIRATQAAGFTPVSLGPRVLRTETAGLAALAGMMALWGDW